MIRLSIRQRFEESENSLSPFAARASCAAREMQEDPSLLRTEFQKDRDRIIHSKAFRRLKHKTQVFISPTGDHYVTRLTHTLEVAQIARTISRALNLNEDLTEAIALGHDLGHTPFGHVGEDELSLLLPKGFRHAEQSLRIVEKLENDGLGLNLTSIVRQGILLHSKPRGDFLGERVPDGLSLEGQVVRISDALAYLNHDLDDAFRARILSEDDVPSEIFKTLGTRHMARINTMVTDVVSTSWVVTGEDIHSSQTPSIDMSPSVRDAVNSLRDFMFEKVYVPEDKGEEGRTARDCMHLLYNFYHGNASDKKDKSQGDGGTIVDYIAGMTDRYAIRLCESIEPGITKNLNRAISL